MKTRSWVIMCITAISLLSCATNSGNSKYNTLAIGSFRFIDKSSLASIIIRHADGVAGMPISGIVLKNGDYFFMNLKPGKYFVEQLKIKVPGIVSSTLRDLYLGNAVKNAEWGFEVNENNVSVIGIYQIQVKKDKISDVVTLGYGSAKATIGRSDEVLKDVVQNISANIKDPFWQDKLKELL